ncbi:MAG: endolytic transglycosylase MltG [Burkholderiales bacterium]
MRLLRRLVLLMLLLSLLLAGAVVFWLERPLPLATEVVELSIEAGTPPSAIANDWVDAGVQTSPRLLYEWFRWSGQAKKIRAGSYEIDRNTTPRSLLQKMVRGDVTLATVRFIEGWTMRQVRAELAKADSLTPSISTMSDAELMAALGAPGQSAEGAFFPDTYAYNKGSSDLAVLRRAHHAMNKKLAAAWEQRAADLPLKTPQQALILASIIEKETGSAQERRLVSSVFINRLRLGMLLQTDPTVIYGLGPNFDGNLRKRDLLTDTPYNTYTRAGLPPTPIAMPGKASLLAAVQPEQSKALYFVARGDGSSEFSDNLAAHNRAVNKYQRGGK